VERRHELTVEGPLLTEGGGTIPVEVLSTPGDRTIGAGTHERRGVQRAAG